MTTENKRECRFYTCLGLAYILMMISLFLPPLNVITQSVLYASLLILSVGALAVGIDVKGILYEIRMMRNNALEKIEDKEDGTA